MRVVAYSIQAFEKEPLAIANHKKHEITLISNALTEETADYAAGKEAVIVNDDQVTANVIDKLADLGVKFLATRSTSTTHIDQAAAAQRNIKIANVPAAGLEELSEESLSMALATETILNLDKWQAKKCLGDACVCSRSCDQAQNLLDKKDGGHEH